LLGNWKIKKRYFLILKSINIELCKKENKEELDEILKELDEEVSDANAQDLEKYI